MQNHNWLVTDDGQVQDFGSPEVAEGDRPYRLYRFLTELEDILDAVPQDSERIQAIAPRMRQLLTSSYWLQLEYSDPNPETGWAVNFLYREYQFPLTVQMVSWAPGTCSTIHNHATWGLVLLIGGQEKNRLWRRQPTPEAPHNLEYMGERVLSAGDLIAFTPDAVHQVEPLGDEPTVSFNLYGVTDYSNRYIFDPAAQTAKHF